MMLTDWWPSKNRNALQWNATRRQFDRKRVAEPVRVSHWNCGRFEHPAQAPLPIPYTALRLRLTRREKIPAGRDGVRSFDYGGRERTLQRSARFGGIQEELAFTHSLPVEKIASRMHAARAQHQHPRS